MSSLHVSALMVSSSAYIGECYFVIGQWVGKVKILEPKKDYYDEINYF